MKKTSLKITSLIILFSIVTIFVQFGSYFLIKSIPILIGIYILTVLIFSHISLIISFSYKACYFYTFLIVSFYFFGILLLHFSEYTSVNNYDNFFFIVLALNWLVPTIYSILQRLMDNGHRYLGFRNYFIKTSLLFFIFYFVLILRSTLQSNSNLLGDSLKGINLIPFFTIATSIENYILDRTTLSETLLAFGRYILLAMPLGFYLRLLLKYCNKLFRLFVFLLVPTIVEGIQYVVKLGTCDIDDIILTLFGSLIGVLLYHILNHIFVTITGDDFLYERSYDSYSRRQLF